jgi:subtilase family serine protease
MKNFVTLSLVGFVMSLGTSALMAQGQSVAHARVLVPDSTVEHPEDVGQRAHTNHLVLLPEKAPSPQASSPSGETPASLGCVYQVVSPLTTGCPISGSTTNPSGGSGTIAIVDAYDYPTAYNDLKVFSSTFGLPVPPLCSSSITTSCFQVVYASGSKPRGNCGWNQEAALDIEWAHAMAPNARIVLVEAASNSFANLFKAVDVASGVVTGSGMTGQVSMSWGGSEFSSESGDDSHFATTGVVYFASSGDTGGKTIYPGVSPNVVCAGGTSVNRTGGNFTSETGWSGSGGGPSTYESIPGYQSVIASIVGTKRGVPDFSFDANPYTGVSVYDSTSCQGMSGWLVFGGTSVASPSLAGIVNLSGSQHNSSDTELSTIYSCYATSSCYSSNFRDIKSGTAGSFSAGTGWDFVTGVGSNIGTASK